MWKCVVVVLCILTVGCSVENEEETVLQKPEELKNDSINNTHEIMNHTEGSVKQTWKRCLHKFDSRCVKIAMSLLMERLPQLTLRIAPGITLLANSSRSLELVALLRTLTAVESADTPHIVVLHRLKQLLDTVTVRVELEDPGLLRKVKTLSEEVVDGLVTTGESEGRKKGGGGALLWSAGALAAVGFAALAAVAGKAMMASLMALMLAGMTALRGNGGGGGGGGGGHKSHVEIIKAPAHYELAPAPHFEAGGHAFEHDHYYTAPGYEYGRQLTLSKPRVDQQPPLPAHTTYKPA